MGKSTERATKESGLRAKLHALRAVKAQLSVGREQCRKLEAFERIGGEITEAVRKRRVA